MAESGGTVCVLGGFGGGGAGGAGRFFNRLSK